MKYFKVGTDYKNHIPINESELPKAVEAFITGNPVIFTEGATRRIDTITPDYARIMGWNRGYEPNAEDWNYIAKDSDCIAARKMLPEMIEEVKKRLGNDTLKLNA